MRFTGYLPLALFFLCHVAQGNDASIFGEGGRMVRLDRENTSIQMVREKIVMDIAPNADDYVVTVDFVFRNHGGPTEVLMGFPESGDGDIDVGVFNQKTSFDSFATWVDGRRVRATRRPLRVSGKEDYVTHWVKNVHFANGQTRKIRVRYHTHAGGTSSRDRFVTYNFTGGNWKGEVEESTLLIKFRPAGSWFVSDSYGSRDKRNRRPVKNRKRNILFYRWRHWQAEEGLYLSYINTLPGALLTTDSPQELTQEPREILIENKPSRRKREVARVPMAFVRRGIGFIQLSHLHSRLVSEYSRKRAGRQMLTNPQLLRDRKTKRITLKAHGHSVIFKPDTDVMIVDGKRTVKLPDPPVSVRRDSETSTFVPLRAVLDTLNIKFSTKARTRLFWLDLPW